MPPSSAPISTRLQMTERCEVVQQLRKRLFHLCKCRFLAYRGGEPKIRDRDVRFFIQPSLWKDPSQPGRLTFSAETTAQLKKRRSQEMKIWDGFLQDIFRMDCVEPLTRGTYGHPYLMIQQPFTLSRPDKHHTDVPVNQNQQRYVLKFMFYQEHVSSDTKLKRQKLDPSAASTEMVDDEVERPENADVLINTLLSNDVASGALPFVTLPIASFVCSETNVRNIMMKWDPVVKEARNKLLTARHTQMAQTRKRSKNTEEKVTTEDLTHPTDVVGELQQECERVEATWLEAFCKHMGRRSMHQAGNPRGGVLVYLAEYASLGSLSDYAFQNGEACDTEIWRSLLAQCFYALAYFQNQWPQFRHNDLHPGNVLLEKVPLSTYHLTLPDATKCIPLAIANYGLEVRLWDFDYSSIAGVRNNIKTDSGARFGISSHENHYYDVHTLCNSLLADAANIRLPAPVLAFLEDIVPLSLRYSKHRFGRLQISDQPHHWSPLSILRSHSFFAPFRPASSSTP